MEDGVGRCMMEEYVVDGTKCSILRRCQTKNWANLPKTSSTQRANQRERSWSKINRIEPGKPGQEKR